MKINVSKPELKAIFERLGGRVSGASALARLLNDFYARMARDALLGFFFDGKDIATIAGHQRAFLMRAMGATESYAGKPPATAHEHMAPILKGHFDRRLVLLEQTLRDHGLDERDIRTWVAFENSFRDAVVREEKPGPGGPPTRKT